MANLFSLGRHLSDQRLLLWLDGELSPAAASRIIRHLKQCASCSRREEDLRRSLHWIEKNRGIAFAVPDGVLEDLPQRFERRLEEAERGREFVSFARPLAPRTMRRLIWTTALSGICLTLAMAMPSRTARALFEEIWQPFFRPAPSLRAPAPPSPPLPSPLAVLRTPKVLPAPPRVNKAAISTPAAPLPPRPTLAERETAEVDARYALHRIRACMGEQVDYSTDAEGYALVRALVDTGERKQELQSALAGIPWLHTQIRTIAESLNEAAPLPHRLPLAVSRPTAPPAPAAAAPRRKLKIPPDLSRARALEISGEAIASSMQSMQNAWAIRHVLSAYPVDRLARLSPQSREKLVSMLTDHAAEWRKVLARFRAEVRPMLRLEFSDTGAVPAESDLSSASSLFEQAEALDAVARGLFSETDKPAADPSVTVPEFYSKMSILQAALAKSRVPALLSAWCRCSELPETAAAKP